MTMLLPLFILVGFIAGYFVNAIAYHLSPLEDKTALTFRQGLFLGDIEKCAIVADAQFDIKTRTSYTVKITGNQGELATCHTLCLSR